MCSALLRLFRLTGGTNTLLTSHLAVEQRFKKKSPFQLRNELAKLVIPSGFEPETDRLEICCSIQLSYGTIAQCFGRCKDADFVAKGQSSKKIFISIYTMLQLPFIKQQYKQAGPAFLF